MIGTALWDLMDYLIDTSDGQFQDRPDAFVFNGQAGTVKIDKTTGALTLRDEHQNMIYNSKAPLDGDRDQAMDLEAKLRPEMLRLTIHQEDRDRKIMIANIAKRRDTTSH